MKELESGLLYKLANAEGDILEDIELIESLEFSKKLSMEISEKVEIAKETAINITIACEFYRPAASRGALVFFLLMELTKIHSFYKFSLDSFIIVVIRAIKIVADQMNPKKKKAKPEGDEAPPEGEEGAEGDAAEDEEEEIELTKEDLDFSFYDDDEINIGSILNDEIILRIPYNYYCKDQNNCKLLGPTDPNITINDNTDPRWQGLKNLKNLKH